MKKRLAVIIGIAITSLLLVIAMTVVTAMDIPALYGDVNKDGTLTLADVVLLNRAIAGNVNLDYYARNNADCNLDKTIDVSDAILIQQFLTRVIGELPYTL